MLRRFCLSVAPLASVLAFSMPANAAVKDVDGVKSYLVDVTSKMDAAAAKFAENAKAYAAIIDAYKGDYATAYAAKKSEIDALVKDMRENYKAMDSYGYETVEGIVGGVDSFAHYDRDLDAGVPAAEGAEGVAEVILPLRNGEKIDRKGSVFTFIIEPALWGGDPRWITPLDLDGDGKIAPRESLPKAEVLLAASDYSAKQIASLKSDSSNWKPTTADCISAMIVMTPTLSDYFEDWKESRYSEKQSGHFFAVSRVSDMRGIMGSCAIMYQAVDPEVAAKDPALAKSVRKGFDGITVFLDKIDAKEKDGTVTLAEIDEMASQAKGHTDKLVPQIEQAQALVEKN
jgi:Imelysin